jgi:mannose-6-phosphate isomerase-like protein (cupin superfamily)
VALWLGMAASAAAQGPAPATAQPVPLAQRIGHSAMPAPPPAGPAVQNAVHAGAGSMTVTRPLDMKFVQGEWGAFQRGVLWPNSSNGEHFHEGSEEVFVILGGDAQFTVDGRTSVIPGPAGAPVRLAHAHGVYNPTDKPMEWLSISVEARNGGGGFDNGDSRAHDGVVLDRFPQFVNFRLDRARLQPIEKMDGGTGTVMYRRLLGPGSFSTLYAYTDHFLVPPGASMGAVSKADVSEIYYVLAGAGAVTVNGETAPIKAGDVIPVDFGQTRAFTQSGTEPLELFLNAVARTQAVKVALRTPYAPVRRPPPPAAAAPAR